MFIYSPSGTPPSQKEKPLCKRSLNSRSPSGT